MDLAEVTGGAPALSENFNSNNLEFTVHQEGGKPKETTGKPATQDAAPPKGAQPIAGSMDFVAATLTAWNQCPTIVKKQLDQQYE